MITAVHRSPLAVGALVLLGMSAPVTAAHEQGVLKLANRRLVAGDSVTLVGEKFSKNSKLQVVMVGASGRAPLAEVRTDAAGAFRATPPVPASVAPGVYRLIVLADDGDEVAAVDVEVVAGVAEHHPAGHLEDSAEPTAQPLALERARVPWVTGGAWATVLAALAVAGLLMRRQT